MPIGSLERDSVKAQVLFKVRILTQASWASKLSLSLVGNAGSDFSDPNSRAKNPFC
jgi:hypothetical protein